MHAELVKDPVGFIAGPQPPGATFFGAFYIAFCMLGANVAPQEVIFPPRTLLPEDSWEP